MPTVSVENYLKTIYHLQQGLMGPVRTKAIADALNIASSSVTNMMKMLSSEGLVKYAPYQGAKLTAEGRRQALRTIRNHRLVELFLMKTLGFDWDEVHREAEALEHALSDEVANRIDAFLGHPKFDPHGDPIPDASGEIHRADGVALTELPRNVPSSICRVLDQTPEILRYFSDTGLLLGAVIEVVHEEPFEGPLTVKVGDHTIALSRTIASRIVVERR